MNLFRRKDSGKGLRSFGNPFLFIGSWCSENPDFQGANAQKSGVDNRAEKALGGENYDNVVRTSIREFVELLEFHIWAEVGLAINLHGSSRESPFL